MTSYRRFDLADFPSAPATLAKVATLQADETRTVANVASVARQIAETRILASDPAAWREALLALSPDHDPCPGFRPDAWARVQGNALDFLDRHGEEAARLGWTDVELFGVHPSRGTIRVDHTGALMLSVGGRVESVEAE